MKTLLDRGKQVLSPNKDQGVVSYIQKILSFCSFRKEFCATSTADCDDRERGGGGGRGEISFIAPVTQWQSGMGRQVAVAKIPGHERKRSNRFLFCFVFRGTLFSIRCRSFSFLSFLFFLSTQNPYLLNVAEVIKGMEGWETSRRNFGRGKAVPFCVMAGSILSSGMREEKGTYVGGETPTMDGTVPPRVGRKERGGVRNGKSPIRPGSSCVRGCKRERKEGWGVDGGLLVCRGDAEIVFSFVLPDSISSIKC